MQWMRYQVDNDILKDFLGKNEAKIANMFMEELYWDDRLAQRHDEGKMDSKKAIAQNALIEGLPIEVVQKITGLDMETVKKIHATGQTSYMKTMCIPAMVLPHN